tara:strand:- start:69 stop:236 length:168 start_codon:yes stop_codon:yes gene_type:complete
MGSISEPTPLAGFKPIRYHCSQKVPKEEPGASVNFVVAEAWADSAYSPASNILDP